MKTEKDKFEVEDNILLLVSEILNVEKSSISTESTSQNSPLWDSLNHLKIVAALEEFFSITFLTEEIMTLTSVASLLKRVSELICHRKK
ncbi:acyl carrier protein [Gammaproteobacteria bacterium]|nr:acyl carrier protein [Gammaproteobacteria bacterium]